MAKAIGFIGTIRGKSGNVVFSKGPKGTTTMKPYQPVVSNPKTAAQTEQRAKMNAAGRFSRLWGKATLSPLGGTALENRSKFNSQLIVNSKYAASGQKASIIPEMVEFSNGAQPCPVQDLAIAAEAVSGTNRSNITISGVLPAHSPACMLRTMLAFIPSSESERPASGVMLITAIPANNTDSEAQVSVTMRGIAVDSGDPTQDPDAASRYHAWALGWTPSTEAGRQTYERIVSEVGDDNISADVAESIESSGEFSKTAYVGSLNPPVR